MSCDVLIETPINGGVFLAARVDQGGEFIRQAKGVFYWIHANGTYKVSNDIGNHLCFPLRLLESHYISNMYYSILHRILFSFI